MLASKEHEVTVHSLPGLLAIKLARVLKVGLSISEPWLGPQDLLGHTQTARES